VYLFKAKWTLAVLNNFKAEQSWVQIERQGVSGDFFLIQTQLKTLDFIGEFPAV
jgi:hypothetical protein